MLKQISHPRFSGCAVCSDLPPAGINHSDTCHLRLRFHDDTTPSPTTNDKDNEETMLSTMLQPPPIKLPRVCSNCEHSVHLTHFYCLLPFSYITGSSTPYRVVPCKTLIADHPLSLPSPSILVLQKLAALRAIQIPDDYPDPCRS